LTEIGRNKAKYNIKNEQKWQVVTLELRRYASGVEKFFTHRKQQRDIVLIAVIAKLIKKLLATSEFRILKQKQIFLSVSNPYR